MGDENLAERVGYCGLPCSVCAHGCLCKASPQSGDRQCYQRRCCVAGGIDGCWQCDEFPCRDGYLGTDQWRGLCIACVRCIREDDLAGFLRLAEAHLAPEFGTYRFRTASEVLAVLRGGSA